MASNSYSIQFRGRASSKPGNLQICSLFLVFTVLAFRGASADQHAADDGGILAGDYRPKVLIVLKPVQTELLGPKPMADASLLNELPYVGFVFAYINSDADVENTVKTWREMSGPFNFHDAVLDGIANLDKNTSWQIAEIEEVDESLLMGGRERIAQRMMRDEGYDYVFYVKFIYFITPGLDQIRTRISLLAYARDIEDQLLERNYEYLSRSRGELFRPFIAGEKVALIEAIENQYKLKVEQFPNNRRAYSKDRKDALNALKKREVILPIMAINEGWPGDSFETELRFATDNILEMVQEDLIDISVDQVEDQEFITFNGFDLKGRPEIFEGYVVGNQGLNTVYRDRDGNMYSVP